MAVIAVLVVVNVPLYRMLFRTFFGSWDNFKDALGWAHKDDVNPFWGWTASSNDHWNNFVAEGFVFVFLGLCAGLVWGEYVLIEAVLRR